MEDCSWMSQAACRGKDTAIFYPERTADTGLAMSICMGCRVLSQCLNKALEGDEHGVWGGTTRRQRIAVQKREALLKIRRRTVSEAAASDGLSSLEVY